MSKSCPVHSNANLSYVGASDVFGIKLNHKICEVCGLGFADEDSNNLEKIIKKYYQDTFWDHHQKRKVGKIHSYLSEALGIRYDNPFSYWLYFKDFISPQALIGEIGSGAGNTLVFLERNGYDVVGVEPDSYFVESANSRLKRGKIIEGFDSMLPGEGYDAIIAIHVLEHLIDPIGFLKQSIKKLKQTGIIFLEVPNCQNAAVMKSSINDPHLWHFTPRALKEILKNMNFKILKEDLLSSKHDFCYNKSKSFLFYTFHYAKRRLFQFQWLMFKKDHFYPDKNGKVYRVVASYIH